MKTITGNDHRQFNAPSIWIALFDITIGDNTYYYTPNLEAITADGHNYEPFPVMLDELTSDGKGEIATVRLICGNIAGLLSTAIKDSSRNVDGEIITFKVYSVDQAAVIYEEDLEILKIEEITTNTIVFELGNWNPFMTKLLQEKFLRDFCWNRYKQSGCWIKKSDCTYTQPSGFTTGSPDTCTRQLSDCKRHTNELRFNAFPGIPGGGGYV